MENRQCSTAVHTALTLVVAALLTICVAPVVHLATPTDGWLDLAAARALDGVDSVMPGDLWLSNALKGTGATLFNPGGWHGPQTWTTSGSPTAGFFEVHLAPGRTFNVHRARGSFPDEYFHIGPPQGWYYKCVTASRQTFVLIPGGIYSKTKENTFAFIIFVNPAAESTADRVKLFKYPIDALTYTKGPGAQWSVRIGESTFGPDSVSVKLVEPDNGTVHLEGDLALAQSQSWPASVLMPDVMGWFAWVPGMECRHGVVSLDAVVTGELFVREKPAGFSTGGGKACTYPVCALRRAARTNCARQHPFLQTWRRTGELHFHELGSGCSQTILYATRAEEFRAARTQPSSCQSHRSRSRPTRSRPSDSVDF